MDKLCTYDPAGVSVGRRGGGAERPQHCESGGKVLEGIGFWPAACHVEQPPQKYHRSVGFTRT